MIVFLESLVEGRRLEDSFNESYLDASPPLPPLLIFPLLAFKGEDFVTPSSDNLTR